MVIHIYLKNTVYIIFLMSLLLFVLSYTSTLIKFRSNMYVGRNLSNDFTAMLHLKHCIFSNLMLVLFSGCSANWLYDI